MPFSCEAYQVFIASPSDVEEERRAIVDAINAWNDLHTFASSLVLLPVRWETHAVAEPAARPQEIINRRVLSDCDILVGVFWSRVGTPTGGAPSGTVEEIREAAATGKHVLLYFSKRALPANVDTDQLSRLRALQADLRKQNLTFDFADIRELQGLIERHLTTKVRQLAGERQNLGLPLPAPRPDAFFLGRYVRTVEEALAEARSSGRPVFMVIYDSKHPKLSKLNHSLGYFMEYQTTKKVVHDEFVQALVDVHSAGARQYVPPDDPLENCLIVLVSISGQIVVQEGVYANPDEGLKRARNYAKEGALRS